MALADTGINILGSLIGRKKAEEDRKRAEALQEEAMRLYDDAQAPTLDRITPERMGTEGWDAIPEDFGNRDARNEALRAIMAMGEQGGMDPGSRLAMEEARRAAALQDTQQRQAITQGMARRGMGGAGEAMMQLQAQQSGADRASMANLQEAASARARALQALATGGSMAAQAEGQDFERSAAEQTARDRIAQFNINNSVEAQRANTALQQQGYQNKLGLMDRRYGARQQRAAQYGQKASDTAQMWGGIGQGVGEAMHDAEGAMTGSMGNPLMMQAYGAQKTPQAAQSTPDFTPATPMDYEPNDPRRRR
jgi:hypothetical protein